MGGKAKPTKHTAKEIAQKTMAATVNRGGGAAGLADRKGGAVGHSKFLCQICKSTAPDLKSAQVHHEAKHPSVAWDPSIFQDLHSMTGGVTTQGIAVRGSTKQK